MKQPSPGFNNDKSIIDFFQNIGEMSRRGKDLGFNNKIRKEPNKDQDLISKSDKNIKKFDIIKKYLIDFSISNVIVLIIFYLFKSYVNNKPKKYCNNEKLHQDCIPCPAYGICRGGALTCKERYILINGYCVLDNDDSKNISEYIFKMNDILDHRAGSYQCKLANDGFVLTDEMESLLFEHFGVWSNSHQRILEIALSYLRSQQNIVVGSQNMKETLESKTPKFVPDCIPRSKTNSMSITVFTASLLLFLITKYFTNYRNNKKIAKSHANRIINKIMKPGSSYTEKEILKHIGEDVSPSVFRLVINEIENSVYVYKSYQGNKKILSIC